jgi:hypothetical protein
MFHHIKSNDINMFFVVDFSSNSNRFTYSVSLPVVRWL